MNMNNFLQINETTRKRLSDFLFILWAGGAALLSYSLVYALRKPFTAASFENAEFFDMDYKVVVTISQILGYVISKFIGIKLISELKPEERFKFILTSVLLAEASLVLFGLLSTPFNVAAMFLNGLSLGCMWGVIFSFIEGRRVTDILASLLGVSMVISSGTAKSIGLYVMNHFQVSEFWMPALIGTVALPLLLLLGWALNKLPEPNKEDIAMKSERETLNGKQRWELFKSFMPFLSMLFVANIAIVVLRDIKEDFLVNIIDVTAYSPWLFAQIDSVVTLIILGIFGLMVLVKDNLKALSVLFGLIITGMIVMAVVSFGQQQLQLSPVIWLFIQSLCLYIAYLTFQTIFFDRFIACFRIRGNVGFFIVTTDFLGYTGTVLVLVLKEFCNPDIDWAVFYNRLAGYVGIFCCVTFVCSFVYLHQRFRKETGVTATREETIKATPQNAITVA
jgi:MFS family permease